MSKTFSYPKSVRSFWYIFCTLSVTGLFILFLSREQLNPEAFIVLFLIVCAFLAGAIAFSTKAILDDEKIIVQNSLRAVTIKWSEIEDVHCSPRLLTITSIRQKRRIKIFRGDYGLSLEPFDQLQQEVNGRVSQRLSQVWEQVNLPLTCNYPRLQTGTIVGYLVALCILLFYFVIVVIKTEGFLLGNILFLVAAALVVGPFFLRDYRKSRRKLIVEQDGLHERNGRELFVAWQAVQMVVIREPPGFGYGSILVQGRDGVAIKFPRAISNSGQLLYLIKKKTNIEESYGFEG